MKIPRYDHCRAANRFVIAKYPSEPEHEHENNWELIDLIYVKCPYCECIEKFPDSEVFSVFFIPFLTMVRKFPALPDGRVLIEHKRCRRIIVLSQNESRTLYPVYRDFARRVAEEESKMEVAST